MRAASAPSSGRAGRRIAGNAGGDLCQRGNHAAEFPPHERLHVRGRRGVGRAQPPPLERHAGETRQPCRREAGQKQPAPAHARERRTRR